MRLFPAIAFLAVLLGLQFAKADDFADRRAMEKSVIDLFMAEKFDALDAMADEFRTSRERTSSGIWKLTVFYDSFSSTVRLDEKSYAKLENLASAWIDARPNSIAAKLTYAQLLNDHAWVLRGDDYWANLTEQQRRDYMRYHTRFRYYLIDIKNKTSADPQWYALMSTAAVYEGWDDESIDAFISEAIDKEPYYYQTYFNLFTHYQSKWGGEPSKLKDLIFRITNHTKSHDGKSFIARGYWVASRYGKEVVENLGLEWTDINSGFRDLIKQYPDQWNLNAYAKFSCLAEDRVNFAIAYSQIKVRPIVEAWDYPGQSIICATWAMHPERHIQVK
ncbi:DUF4034 domain-containing protein [Mesorhizobium sp. CU2]|uniref:DUF4034 domain-containing protein n=1 Tax=unclassified Mesorhizobium TaxID=325217 RepID=UPI0011260F47|nr:MULTISPECIES: DUF4034 domain-containing protein [unclassified Mesorhizobium]TPN75982.1 DUF4034 domain-containing protein [Mesorhizobium sp. CU3]TPO07655.1 DUF4034 domain-containing protein [Mesorhizobium sp. CU2]